MRAPTYRRLCFLEVELLSLGILVGAGLALSGLHRWALLPIGMAQLIVAVSYVIRAIRWRTPSLRLVLLLGAGFSLSGLLDYLDLHHAARILMITTQYAAALLSVFRISATFSIRYK